MREIKFRAWDSEIEKFIYSDKGYDENGESFFEFTEGKLKAFAIRDHGPGYPPEERVYSDELEEPEQYTGLKDKNGVEVYEGDKVRITWMDSLSTSEPYTQEFEQEIIEEVEWRQETFSFMPLDEFCAPVYGSKIEVIGNIHES